MASIQKRWDSSSQDLEIRQAILKYMSPSYVVTYFEKIILEGLDDYTTNARGDVGSVVRIAALKTVGSLMEDPEQLELQMSREFLTGVYGKVLRLAAEKLDKVRIEAQIVLGYTLSPWRDYMVRRGVGNSPEAEAFKSYSPSSKSYFAFLLNMQDRESPTFGRTIPFQESW